MAIKVLTASSPRQRERFLREVSALSQLRHPGLVEILDSGEEGGRPWFAMPLVEGGTLEERLRDRGPLEPEALIELGLQLCDALACAHSQGILHRDLKPENVLCGLRGRYVLTDFGLAKDVAREASVRLSATGALQGTPGFWAPEQASGDANSATQSTDVYGVGAVLYAALTGFPPIQAEDMLASVLATQQQRPAPPSQFVSVPAPLEALVLRCLEKVPSERPDSLRALEGELRALLVPDLPLLEQRGTPRARLLGVALGLCLLGTLGGAWALSSFGSPSSRAPTPTPTPTPLASTPPAEPSGLPAWFAALPAEGRPTLPLPEGLSVGEDPGEYVNAQDRSTLVWVPPGSFRMGSTSGLPNERPTRRVTFKSGYFLSKYEVTWAQFDRYSRARGLPPRSRVFAYHGAQAARPSDRHPALGLSWVDAADYCEWAQLRLPSEAEWEFAARGPEGRTYPWGEAPPDATRLNCADQSAAWDWPQEEHGRFAPQKAPWSDGFGFTAPVDSFPAGAAPCGALNLLGNATEWTADLYRSTYLLAPVDGSPAEARIVPKRATRGGAFDSEPGRWRASTRQGHFPQTRGFRYGLRPALGARLSAR